MDSRFTAYHKPSTGNALAGSSLRFGSQAGLFAPSPKQHAANPGFGQTTVFGGKPPTLLINTLEKGVDSQAGKIAHLDFAEKVYRFFGKFKTNVRKFNMSYEDWASRISVLLSIYIPQGLLAWKEKAHQWETNGRNILNWSSVILLTLLVKNDQWGVNTLLNVLMQPKGTPKELMLFKKAQLENRLKNASAKSVTSRLGLVRTIKTRWRDWQVQRMHYALDKVTKDIANTPESFKGSWGHRLLNKFRLDYDAFDFLGKALNKTMPVDRGKAFWASADKNEIDMLFRYKKILLLEAKKASDQKMAKNVAHYINRIAAFKWLSVGLIAGMNVYLIGKFMTDLVTKHVAPLDPDYENPKALKTNKKPIQKTVQSAGGHPSYRQPKTFQMISSQQFGGERLMLTNLALISNIHSSNFTYTARDGVRVLSVDDNRKADYLIRNFYTVFLCWVVYELASRVTDKYYTGPLLLKQLELNRLKQIYGEGAQNYRSLPKKMFQYFLGSMVGDKSHYTIPLLLQEKLEAMKATPDKIKRTEILVKHMSRRLRYDDYLKEYGKLTKPDIQQVIDAADQTYKNVVKEADAQLGYVNGKKPGFFSRLGSTSHLKREALIREGIAKAPLNHVAEGLRELVRDGMHSKLVQEMLPQIQKSAAWPKLMLAVTLNLMVAGLAINWLDVKVVQPWQKKLFKERGTTSEVVLPGFLGLLPALPTYLVLSRLPYVTKRMGYVKGYLFSGLAALGVYTASMLLMMKHALSKPPKNQAALGDQNAGTGSSSGQDANPAALYSSNKRPPGNGVHAASWEASTVAATRTKTGAVKNTPNAPLTQSVMPNTNPLTITIQPNRFQAMASELPSSHSSRFRSRL